MEGPKTVSSQLRQPDDEVSDDCEPSPPLPANSIPHLHPDILETVFGYLDVRSKTRSAQVCLTWRDLVYHPSNWRRVSPTLRLKQLDHHLLLPSLVRRDIRSIVARDLEVEAMRELLHQLRRLENLTLSEITESTICDWSLCSSFTEQLPHLTKLVISSTAVSDQGIDVLQYCPNLVHLDLSGCTQLTDEALLPIGCHLTKLKILNLSDGPDIGDPGLEYIMGVHPQLAAGNPNLESLFLMGCRRVSDWSVQNMVDSLGRLDYLYLGGGDLLTDQAMEAISRMDSLHKLTLDFCPGVTDEGIAILARSASLRALVLRNCFEIFDTGLAALAQGGSKIVELRLESCSGVTNAGLIHVGQLTELRDLYLGDCPDVGDLGLGFLSKMASKLVRLSCRRLTGLSDLALMFVATMTHLRHFCCQFPMTSLGLTFLANGDSQLERLELIFTEVTDAGLPELARMPTLRALNLYGNSKVGLAGLVELIERGSAITSLNVDDIVKQVASEAGKLPFLGTFRLNDPHSMVRVADW